MIVGYLRSLRIVQGTFYETGIDCEFDLVITLEENEYFAKKRHELCIERRQKNKDGIELRISLFFLGKD